MNHLTKSIKQVSSYVLVPYFLILLLLLNACSPEAFPDCCGGDQDDARDAPFSTTYLFQYKTGTTDIVDPNPQRLLRIISAADILTLINAASTSQLNKNGLIGGLIQGFEGPIREAAFQVTDRQGNILSKSVGADRNLFYNSLGRVPDFLVNGGTGDEGTFTLFNAPPGELFFEITKGARGNGRIKAFPSHVSLGRMDALPVFPDKIGVLGVVTDVTGQRQVSDSKISFFGKTENAAGNAAGLFILPLQEGLPTEGEFLVHLSAPSFGPWETVHFFDTGMARVRSRQQAFDPLTIDNLVLYSENRLQELATRAGVPLDRSWGIIVGRVRTADGTGQGLATVKPLDKEGNALDKKEGQPRIFYFQADGQLDPSLTKTTDNSRFILFMDNCNAGHEIFLHSYSVSVTLPIGVSTGRGTSYCEPGKVFSVDIVQKSMFIDKPPLSPPIITVGLEGNVQTEEGSLVPNAEIQILGSAQPSTPITAVSGSYQIEPGLQGEISPLIANGNYIFRTALNGTYLPTYQEVFIGASEGTQNLTLLKSSLRDIHCPAPGTLNMLGTIRDLGLLDAARQGRAINGISLQVLQENGAEVGRVVYIGASEATSNSGQFLVCDLPGPGLYQVRVTSDEDSGTKLVQNHGDGVTIFSMSVNKALPRTVNLHGKIQSLFEAEAASMTPVDGAKITVHGTQRVFNSDSQGNFNIDLGSNSHYIVQVEKEGYLRTDNYHIETPVQSEEAPIPALWSLSSIDLETMAAQADVAVSPQDGILAGKVVVRGVEPTGTPVGSVNADPLIFLSGFFDDDSHVDLLSISQSGTATRFSGDGLGGMLDTSSTCANLPIAPQKLKHADLNRDGFFDLVAIAGDSLFIFMGNRDGCFNQTEEIPVTMFGGNPKAFDLVDLTGDDFVDILVTTDAQAPLERLNNRRNGSFIPPKKDGDTAPVVSPAIKMEGSCGTAPVSVLARLSSSGALIDIIIADAVTGVCEISYNSDEKALPTRILTLPAPLTPSGLKDLQTAFLDTDATLDVLVLHSQGGAFFSGLAPSDVTIITIPLAPSFSLPGDFDTSTATFVDLNRDNRNDLLIGGANALILLLGNGDGTFGASAPVSSSATPAFTLADYNEDGKVDVIGLQGTSLMQFLGEDSAREGVSIDVLNGEGTPIGRLAYLDEQGQIQPEAEKTSKNGRFIVFNVPPGEAFTRVNTGGSGNSSVTVFAGSLAYFHLNMNDTSPSKVKLDGQVINPTAGEAAGVAVDRIKITPLGTGTTVLSRTVKANPAIPDDLDKEGVYQMELGATSEYIIKLDP